MADPQRITFPELNPIYTANRADEVLLQVDGESRRATLNTLRSVFAEANSEITIISNDGLEVGMYADFAGDTAPVSYLLCDGSAVSREEYSELFSVIGTKYGAGDGSTTFNLPNKIGRFAQGSTTVGTVVAPGLPNIHGAVSTGHSLSLFSEFTGCFSTNGKNGGSVAGDSGVYAKGFIIDASLSSSIYGASSTVQPPALTVLPCIKAFKVNLSDGSNNSFASYIGQIITTLVPLNNNNNNNNNVLLLNGQTVSRTDGEDISAFIDYIKLLSQSYSNILISASDYEAALSATGSCGKFVLDDEAGTLRLPLIQNILQGTTSNLEVGNSVSAGLPDIYADFAVNTQWNIVSGSGAIYNWANISANSADGSNRHENFATSRYYFSASKHNSIYGRSTTVQPPTIKVLHYIVINNNAGKNKANTNLSNLTQAGKNVIANMAMPSLNAISLTIPQSGSTITPPSDGYLTFLGTAGNQYGHVNMYTSSGTGSMVGLVANTSGKAFLPIKKGVPVTIDYMNLANSFLNFTYAEGAS